MVHGKIAKWWTAIFTAAAMSACFAAVVANAQQPNTLTSRETADGWQLLFNGQNLDGWHSYGESGPGRDWSVRHGTIRLRKNNTDPERSYQDLVTDQEFSDFDLKLEWKAKPCIDSGIMFYVHESPKYKQTYETGPEMQIADLACTVPDSRVLMERAGDLFDMIPIHYEWVKLAGEWNQYEIIANRGHLQFFQNGHKVLDTQLGDAHWKQLVAGTKFAKMPGYGAFHKGHISLQGTESKGKSGDKIWFRNIKIKKL